jgi:hypothetical protein
MQTMQCLCNITAANFTSQLHNANNLWSRDDIILPQEARILLLREDGEGNETKKRPESSDALTSTRSSSTRYEHTDILPWPAATCSALAPRLLTASTASVRRPLPASSALAVPEYGADKTKIPQNQRPTPKLSEGRESRCGARRVHVLLKRWRLPSAAAWKSRRCGEPGPAGGGDGLGLGVARGPLGG